MTPQATTAFHIRAAVEADASGILACLAAAFEPYRDAYTSGAFADTVLDPAALRRRMSTMTVLVAESHSAIIGTIAWNARAPAGHLRGMAVLPGQQGTAVAAALLEAAEDQLRHAGCTRVTLDTTELLQRAIHFYTRRGYSPTDRVSDFFGMRLHEYARTLD